LPEVQTRDSVGFIPLGFKFRDVVQMDPSWVAKYHADLRYHKEVTIVIDVSRALKRA